MLFCPLGRADSLREICHGRACCVGNTSDLAGCLRRRQDIGQRKTKFRFKSKRLSLDLTTLSLCLSLFPWARFRRAKGAIKGKPAAATTMITCPPMSCSRRPGDTTG